MITVDQSRKEKLVGAGIVPTATYYGLSTDDKPSASNGSCFMEMDTGKIYFYDAAGAEWLEWGASS